MTEPPARVTRAFHEGTKLRDRPSELPSILMPDGFTPMERENKPVPFKRYPGAPRLALPRDTGESDLLPATVLSGRANVAPPDQFGAALLARLLFYSAGVTRVHSSDGKVVSWFRAAPAAGNLHPVETYVICGDVGEIAAGTYHFGPGDFSLETVRVGDRRTRLAEALADEAAASAQVSLVLTGLPWSTGWKYTTRGLRHIYWDAGSLLAQTLSIAEAAGLAARVHLAFIDSEVSDELGVDGVNEFPVAVVTFGQPGVPPSPGEPGGSLVSGDPEPASPRPVEFPELTSAQHAGDLSDAAAVERWRTAAAELGHRTAPPSAPAGSPTPSSIEELIRRRGSTRMFRTEEIPGAAAQWCLGVASRAVPSDFCRDGATLLSHFVSIHGVGGVTPGLYEWREGDLSSRSETDATAARSAAERLCLGQALGGDSAFTVFHCVDLDGVFEALGDRGYRAAQLEAGLAAGRLQLAAFAMGLGGTGLTFFDDAVSGAFGTDQACMLVTAVGPADYRSRPGGLPGRPTEMSGFAPPVVERFKARFERDDA